MVVMQWEQAAAELRCWTGELPPAIDALLRFAWSKADGELRLLPQMPGTNGPGSWL